jgi:hypothetical protein
MVRRSQQEDRKKGFAMFAETFDGISCTQMVMRLWFYLSNIGQRCINVCLNLSAVTYWWILALILLFLVICWFSRSARICES